MKHIPAAPVAGTARRLPARLSRLHPAFTLVEVLVVMAILVIIAGTVTVGTFKYLDMAKRKQTELKMQKIENAAKTYQITYDELPTDPMQLVNASPDGSAPLLEGGEEAALDPWGEPFTLTVVTDDFGSTRIRVQSNGNGTPIFWPRN